MDSNISTSDFYLAAYLLAEQVPIVGHNREGDRSTFEFQGDDLDTLMNKFYTNAASVAPRLYAKSIRDLKSVMYNGTTIKPRNNYENSKGSQFPA